MDMSFELGSVLTGIAAIIVGIVTIIITTIYNRKSIDISNKNLKLAQDNFEECVLNKNNLELYNSIGQDIVSFLQYSSIYKIKTYYRRAILNKQEECNIDYIADLINCVEKIKTYSHKIIIFDIILSDSLKEKVQKCQYDSIKILDDLVDLKVAVNTCEEESKNQGIKAHELLRSYGIDLSIKDIRNAINSYGAFYDELEKELLIHSVSLKTKLVKIANRF